MVSTEVLAKRREIVAANESGWVHVNLIARGKRSFKLEDSDAARAEAMRYTCRQITSVGSSRQTSPTEFITEVAEHRPVRVDPVRRSDTHQLLRHILCILVPTKAH
jgi:hypothetical protein